MRKKISNLGCECEWHIVVRSPYSANAAFWARGCSAGPSSTTPRGDLGVDPARSVVRELARSRIADRESSYIINRIDPVSFFCSSRRDLSRGEMQP